MCLCPQSHYILLEDLQCLFKSSFVFPVLDIIYWYFVEDVQVCMTAGISVNKAQKYCLPTFYSKRLSLFIFTVGYSSAFNISNGAVVKCSPCQCWSSRPAVKATLGIVAVIKPLLWAKLYSVTRSRLPQLSRAGWLGFSVALRAVSSQTDFYRHTF